MELNNALQALTDLKLEQQILAYFFKVCGAEDTLVRVMRIAPQWFGGQGNARLFRVLRTYLRKNPGCSIHSSAVKRHIDNRWGLDSTDGAETAIAFAEVHALGDVPKANQIGPLISELEDLYTKRVMAEALLEELGNIQHSSARKVASRVLGVAAQVGKGVAHTISSDRAMVKCERLIAKLIDASATPGVASGIPQLDAQMLGFYPSRLYAVAARSGGGKSRLLLNLAWNQAVKLRFPVLYFSLEMSAVDLSVLIASRTLALDYMDLFRGSVSKDEMHRIRKLRKEWKSDPPPLLIVDLPGRATAVDLHREMENYKVTHGRIPRCVFVDYAGIMSATHERHDAQKYEQLDDVFRDLKQFARDWKVPVITALQLNRESVKADHVGLEHVALSDRIADHLDTAWALQQRERDVAQTAVDMTFLKQRYGSKKPLVLWANWPMSYLGEVPAVQQQKLNEQAQADAQNVAHVKDL